ncbi:nucleotide sugar dehydrogenase [Ruegeria sp. Ofav3-42]|uniref:nucleotide sugar dehydrogenase n=1 Tax=Ruegeria sp. Ofav3-42 TaxID=2917759 RepID=UPI001EF73325|nr:nucleotide sugar dehydrogenase [Ruegeria sp. Ofav3-42]MCG7522403.1 nucleotide sugar dehydrogenase [Ruegeria sp. Ofav3-42]
MDMENATDARLLAALNNQTARIGVVGLGYVGLPLAVTAALRGFAVTGFDIDQNKIRALDAGNSYVAAVTHEMLQEAVDDSAVSWTTDFSKLSDCDVIVICVPTPLTRHREPDLSFVKETGKIIAENMRDGTLIVLESTTFPGTTKDILTPILALGGLEPNKDFWVAFSPEREDPGNKTYRTHSIPKIVGGDSDMARTLAVTFYSKVVDKVVPVSSAGTAEAVKITENIFRAVNIALVNELKMIYDAMGIDVWEVIDGAATKPFGFMPFYPGPGLGGHCIPIDPFYLTWKAREYGHATRFIELAGEINVNMPHYVVAKLREALDRQCGKGLSKSRVLLVGISYKKNVPDMRESPSVVLMDMLLKNGAEVDFLDPHIDSIPRMREFPHLLDRESVQLGDIRPGDYDAVLISTDHDAIDYEELIRLGLPIVDTRNAISSRGLPMDLVTKA